MEPTVLEQKKSKAASPKSPTVLSRIRGGSPRIWYGFDAQGWFRSLTKNRFRMHLPGWYFAFFISLLSLNNTALRKLQDLLFDRRIRRLQLTSPPIFIIGHWRTGTTLLHELLTLDSQFTYPNTYQCFAPNHFLLTERLNKRWLSFFLPQQRPMDNMAVGLDRPQEDEFALCIMGLPSPYERMLFPNGDAWKPAYLSLDGFSTSTIEQWKTTFVRFLKHITYRNPGQIVLKSPPHTCRIKLLTQLFPEAKFVHIVRNPYRVIPSMLHMLRSLLSAYALQKPNFADLEEQVFNTFDYLYSKLEDGRTLLKPGQLHQLRYEDLIRDPLGEMEAVYRHLKLHGFEQALPALQAYVQRQADYKTNRYRPPAELQDRISERCAPVIKKYGYSG
ncbi:sulfotransferase [candidate division KSB1 bacterium]|nr:sulfotransferase [candidate division KSB1 bacterium]NIR70787.1 sulfotransferase [candidate division KSB1 bacterium]NIS24609.1 sulfotransferase [candidate division KSB1 bacterium]NIT71518.1 sulfotransferase [candidate division KSB1 bacterium]NIU25209.1 sulfotransferase [candidate division KSB1 bacterium]